MLILPLHKPLREFTYKLVVLLTTIVSIFIGVVSAFSASPLAFYTIATLQLAFISIFLLFIYPRAIEVTILLLVAAVTINAERFNIPIKPDLVVLGILACVLTIRSTKTFLSIQYVPLLLPAVGYIFANLGASVLNSPVSDISIRQTIILFGRIITFIIVVISLLRVPTLRKKIPLFFSLILILQTGIGITALTIYPYRPSQFVYYGLHGASTISVNGFFLEPNLFGIFSLCVVSLITPIFLLGGNWETKIPRFTIPIGLLGIALSYTRSTWLGLILAMVCLSIIIHIKSSQRARKYFYEYVSISILLGVMLVTTALIYMLLGGESNIIKRMTVFTSINDPSLDSASVRLLTWEVAFLTWQQDIWIGNGPLSSIAFGSMNGGWLYSSLIQTLHDSGLVGLFFMLWFCIGSMLYTLRAYCYSSDNTDSGILLGYLLAQVSLFFTSQFSSFFWGGFYWVLLGLAVGHSHIVLKHRYNSR